MSTVTHREELTTAIPGPTDRPRVAIVVASTHHGNTRKVADAMAAELDATVFSADEIGPAELDNYDVIGLGSGIYFGRHHSSIRKLASGMQRPRSVFVFSTAGIPFLSCLFHWPVASHLKRCGHRLLGEFSCRGWDTVGPLWLLGGINRKRPNSRDLRNAKAFAAIVRDRVSHAEGTA